MHSSPQSTCSLLQSTPMVGGVPNGRGGMVAQPADIHSRGSPVVAVATEKRNEYIG